MKLTMFVSNAASTAGKPDDKQNVLRLNLPPKSDKVDDENKAVFPDESKKSGVVEFQGITDAIQAEFKGGQRVIVTIEVAK